jgi:hypothetical protein
MVPAKIVTYLVDSYNTPQYKVQHRPHESKHTGCFQEHMNIFHFSRSPGDFSVYDISACYDDSHKLHLMVTPSTRHLVSLPHQLRMGWTMDMDIEGTESLFQAAVREVGGPVPVNDMLPSGCLDLGPGHKNPDCGYQGIVRAEHISDRFIIQSSCCKLIFFSACNFHDIFQTTAWRDRAP